MLTIIISLVSVIAAVLQIILFFKVWRMCNKVKRISEKLESYATIDDLIFLSQKKSPRFMDELERTVYNDLYRVFFDDDIFLVANAYAATYDRWLKRCSTLGWEFPEVLQNLPQYTDFSKKFRFSVMTDIE